jgi:hypothetical protein
LPDFAVRRRGVGLCCSITVPIGRLASIATLAPDVRDGAMDCRRSEATA